MVKLHFVYQDEGVLEDSYLEVSSDSEEIGTPSPLSKTAGREDLSTPNGRRPTRRPRRSKNVDPESVEVEYGTWNKKECFQVEKGLKTFGYVFIFYLYAICFQ